MSNMSYCRFQNTYSDLFECYETLVNEGVKALEKDANQYEKPYIKKLVELCKDITEEFEDEIDS